MIEEGKRMGLGMLAVLLAVLLLSGCTSQPPEEKVYRIGMLSGSDAFIAIADGFKARMADLGYVEGRNITYDFRKLNADPAGYDRVCREFVDEKVDLIFTFPTEPTQAAKEAAQGTGIPVVFAHAGLENSNLVNSVSEPGGNITGTRFPGPDLVVKRFEFLLELKPSIKRLYIPYDKNYPNCAPALEALRPVAASYGVALVELPVTTGDEVVSDLEARNSSPDTGMDAIIIMPEILMQSTDIWANLSGFAEAHKIPIVGSSDALITKGSILTYNVNPLESGGLAATIADRVLKGTPAGTIMVATPPAYLKLNYKLAQEFGLNVSEGLLARADEIIR
jgi:putative ABC transport system substrate-binding protein